MMTWYNRVVMVHNEHLEGNSERHPSVTDVKISKQSDAMDVGVLYLRVMVTTRDQESPHFPDH